MNNLVNLTHRDDPSFESSTWQMHIMFDLSEEKFPSLITNHESGLGMSIDLVLIVAVPLQSKKYNNNNLWK